MHVFLFVCVSTITLWPHLPERNSLIASWDCYQREIWLTFRLCVARCLNILIAFVHLHQYLCVCVSFSLNLSTFCWLCQLQHLLGRVALFTPISCLIPFFWERLHWAFRVCRYNCCSTVAMLRYKCEFQKPFRCFYESNHIIVRNNTCSVTE